MVLPFNLDLGLISAPFIQGWGWIPFAKYNKCNHFCLIFFFFFFEPAHFLTLVWVNTNLSNAKPDCATLRKLHVHSALPLGGSSTPFIFKAINGVKIMTMTMMIMMIIIMMSEAYDLGFTYCLYSSVILLLFSHWSSQYTWEVGKGKSYFHVLRWD